MSELAPALTAGRDRVYTGRRWTNRGGIAKRTKATDCKSVIRGFESHCRLFDSCQMVDFGW